MAKKDAINAFLGEGTCFEGALRFEGTIHINGQFKGDIASSGSLVVGAEARLQADIAVAEAVISGEVVGNVIAEKSIELRVPGKMFGDIQAPIVIIHEGVVFEGNCRTKSAKAAEDKKLTVIRTENTEMGLGLKNPGPCNPQSLRYGPVQPAKADIGSPDQIGDLAQTIGRMQTGIRFSLERFRRRRRPACGTTHVPVDEHMDQGNEGC